MTAKINYGLPPVALDMLRGMYRNANRLHTQKEVAEAAGVAHNGWACRVMWNLDDLGLVCVAHVKGKQRRKLKLTADGLTVVRNETNMAMARGDASQRVTVATLARLGERPPDPGGESFASLARWLCAFSLNQQQAIQIWGFVEQVDFMRWRVSDLGYRVGRRFGPCEVTQRELPRGSADLLRAIASGAASVAGLEATRKWRHVPVSRLVSALAAWGLVTVDGDAVWPTVPGSALVNLWRVDLGEEAVQRPCASTLVKGDLPDL